MAVHLHALITDIFCHILSADVPDAVMNLTADVEDDMATLTWYFDTGAAVPIQNFEVTVVRSNGGEGFEDRVDPPANGNMVSVEVGRNEDLDYNLEVDEDTQFTVTVVAVNLLGESEGSMTTFVVAGKFVIFLHCCYL